MCTVLYCTVLYCTVLYCTLLYSTLLYSTLLYRTVMYCTVLLPTGVNPNAVNEYIKQRGILSGDWLQRKYLLVSSLFQTMWRSLLFHNYPFDPHTAWTRNLSSPVHSARPPSRLTDLLKAILLARNTKQSLNRLWCHAVSNGKWLLTSVGIVMTLSLGSSSLTLKMEALRFSETL